MKKPLPSLLISLSDLTLAIAASAAQTVPTFDDLGTDGLIVANDGGLDWSQGD